MTARLLLDPEPQSVRRARVWVGGELERIGRPDLVDAAELGVSELVTNAILHAEPPITVRVIEYTVHSSSSDGTEDSSEVFALVTDLLDSEAYPALDLACAYPMRWGCETVIGHHKTDMGQGQAVLRSKDRVLPLFVSAGHRCDLPTAARLTLACLRGYKLPEPTRLADHWAEQFKAEVR